jgi:aspartyl-tRNA(Asn)/glutamyl-tRNA(Gln) amidotransferase subunit C
MKKEEIKKLADLSRIEIEEGEMESLATEMNAILGYVEQVKKVSAEAPIEDSPNLRNIMREDGEPHERGVFTDKLLNEAPSRDGKFIKVKKIL